MTRPSEPTRPEQPERLPTREELTRSPSQTPNSGEMRRPAAWRGPALLAVIALLLGILAYQAFATYRAVTGAADALAQLEPLAQRSPAQLAVELTDPDHEVRLLRDAAGDLHQIARWERNARFASFTLGWTPWLGVRIRAASDSTRLAGPLADAADATAELLTIYDGATQDGAALGSADNIPNLGSAAVQARRPAQRLDDAVEQINERRRALDAEERAVLPGRAQRLYDSLDRWLPRATTGARAFSNLPDALIEWFGFDRPRTFAILGLERRELRGAGGFLGAVTLIEANAGTFTSRGTWYSYDVDRAPSGIEVPSPLARYMGARGFYLRDMSWYADFPTTAALAEFAIEDALKTPVDAVVAVDTDALAELVRIVGPSLEVPGFPQPVTGDNLHAQFDALINEPGATVSETITVPRHAGELTQVLLREAARLDVERLAGAADLLGTLAASRHVSVWYPRSGTDRLLREVAPALTGALRIPDRGDYVYLTHSDVGWSWTAECVQRTVRYEVWLEPNGAVRTSILTVQLRSRVSELQERWRCNGGYIWHPGTVGLDERPGTFSDYVRLYVPPGTLLHEATGFDSLPEYYSESGAAVIAGLVRIPKDEERTIRLVLAPPAERAVAGAYELFVPKQAGTRETDFTLVVHPAEGTSAQGAAAAATAASATPVEFHSDLSADARFRIPLNSSR